MTGEQIIETLQVVIAVAALLFVLWLYKKDDD